MKVLALLAPSALALHIPQIPLGNLSHVLEPATPEICPQVQSIAAPNDGLHSSLHFLTDKEFRARQAERLSRAVQVPTAVGDFATDPYDEVFEPVVKFQTLLRELFPLVYATRGYHIVPQAMKNAANII